MRFIKDSDFRHSFLNGSEESIAMILYNDLFILKNPNQNLLPDVAWINVIDHLQNVVNIDYIQLVLPFDEINVFLILFLYSEVVKTEAKDYWMLWILNVLNSGFQLFKFRIEDRQFWKHLLWKSVATFDFDNRIIEFFPLLLNFNDFPVQLRQLILKLFLVLNSFFLGCLVLQLAAVLHSIQGFIDLFFMHWQVLISLVQFFNRLVDFLQFLYIFFNR